MGFEMMGLMPSLVAKLQELGLNEPTPIQKKAIPEALNGRDVLGLAQTGTGKTAAFAVPMIQLMSAQGTKPAPKTVRGLILAPTRELAGQIHDTLREYTRASHLRVALVVGGQSINVQINKLQRGTDLLVATPGRLIDLLDRRAVFLDQAQFLVLDEADQMLDLGFIHALRKIAPLLPEERQTMLFSATMPKQMAELAATYLVKPVRIETAPPGKPADKITQGVHFVEQAAKTALLIKLLDKHRHDLALVFSRTKHGAERLMKALDKAGYSAGSIHGNKSQGQRDRALKAFRAGELKILVATDVAARGLDIPDVRHVYNFDLPNVPDNYVHRIGRTARAGRDGAAIAFCSATEVGELWAIEKVIKKSIPVLSGTCPEPEKKAQNNRGGGGGRGKPGGGKPGGFGGKPGNSRRRSGGGGGAGAGRRRGKSSKMAA
jgi:ATP-dependent RNA helicase RhlE